MSNSNKSPKLLLAATLLAGEYCAMAAAANRLTEPEDIDADNPYLEAALAEKDTFTDFGYKKHFEIDKAGSKRILITGSGSYIGESLVSYAAKKYQNLSIDTIDMIGDGWKEKDFGGYDAVFHVAGIAHADIGDVTEEVKQKYYAVNTDLAVATANKAKECGVGQFIYMSSMIVYGNSAPYGREKHIDEHTIPHPANFYGDSKWQADVKVRHLADEDFHVAVLRPPMIYGYGSKGNFPLLKKIVDHTPVFPGTDNARSMCYIDNLCEFLCQLILSGEGGVYFPQNKEYAKTAEVVEKLAKASGRKISVEKLLNPAVAVGGFVPGKIGGMVDKAFGNATYDAKLSTYDGLDYQVTDLDTSIVETVRGTGVASIPKKKAVLFLVNHDIVIYNFRLELVERLLAEGYEVHISSPYGERIDDLIAIGAIYHNIIIDRHGTNPTVELPIIKEYERLIAKIDPLIILGYTIKPNIYGAIVARMKGIPFVANITGLGMAVENGGWQQTTTTALYKTAFTKVQRVFFQNEENEKFFRDHNIANDRHAMLPGSGVNLTRYSVTPMSDCGDGKSGEPIRFAFISRIMKEKGIDQYLAAAEAVQKHYPATEFHVCGFCEDEYEGRLDELTEKGVVINHGMIRDVAGFMSGMHCIVHPTYYPEGLSNVLLESCSCGRAIITTDRSGCREVVQDGINGYMIPERNTRQLIKAIVRFIKLSQEQKTAMGMAGRKLVEEKFDRQIVVEAYMNEIRKIENADKGK